ncbi:MAG: REDY-like protein HapK [Sphingomonadaceae bacterium]
MRIVVLFNLKPGVEPETYEAWARATDMPLVRSLPSVTHFRVYRTAGLFGSDQPAPYSHIEIIDITALDPFIADASSDAVQAVAGQFQQFADNPLFILTEEL